MDWITIKMFFSFNAKLFHFFYSSMQSLSDMMKGKMFTEWLNWKEFVMKIYFTFS